jgi:hypothetical protein
MFSRRVGPMGRVLAVEPSTPACCDRISREMTVTSR